jgi:hypothetical protein
VTGLYLRVRIGTIFEGTDTIRVIDKGGKKKVGVGVKVKRRR